MDSARPQMQETDTESSEAIKSVRIWFLPLQINSECLHLPYLIYRPSWNYYKPLPLLFWKLLWVRPEKRKTVMERAPSLRFLKYPCQSNAVSSECVFYLSRVIESEDETHSPPSLPPWLLHLLHLRPSLLLLLLSRLLRGVSLPCASRLGMTCC